MNKILLIGLFTSYVMSSELVGFPPKPIVYDDNENIEFEAYDDYIKIPTNNKVDYSKYRPITKAEEEAKAKAEAEEEDDIPMAKTYPIEEGEEYIDSTVLQKHYLQNDNSKSILEKIANIIGINLK